ncbi:MAG: hypothetical protein IJK02_07805 [Clostridia bacterium]|nr:hypothetical protein [Clostridia bacterium]MBR0538050.1 hypothetical protein [Clostridia bacterium]
MWNLLYPILLVVGANILYNICTRSTAGEANAFASLSVTYLLAAALSFVGFFVTSRGKNLFAEYAKLNWSSFALGVVIIGLEIGYILAYRNGWKMNTVSVTANIALAVALIPVAFILYRETVSLRQVAGIVVCCGGLALLSL